MKQALHAVGQKRTRKRLVVVSDDWTTRKGLADLLCEEGYEVLEARDGAELSSLLESTTHGNGAPDLVISDVCAPGAFGFHALARVRRTHPTVPVILVTTFGTFGGVSAREKGARRGDEALLDNPFRLGALRDLVRRLTRSGA